MLSNCKKDKDIFSGSYKVTSVIFIAFNSQVSEQVTESSIVIKRLNEILGAYDISVKTKITLNGNILDLIFEFIAFESVNENENKLEGSTNLSYTTIQYKKDELIFTLTGRLGDNLPSIGSRSIKVEKLLIE
jgi:hypothetical protein